jgi:Fe-S cluster assembly protein SufD
MGAVTLMRTPAETALAQAFETAKGKLPGDRSARERAFNDFIEVGLPHRRVEEFKYTDLRAAMREAEPFADEPSAEDARAAAAAAKAFGGAETAAVVTIVNGYCMDVDYADEATKDALTKNVQISSLRAAQESRSELLAHLTPVPLAAGNPVYRLNSAFMTDGVLIHVSAKAAIDRPIHLRFMTTGAAAVATASRTLVLVEEGASVTLLESHEGPDGVASQLNDVVEVIACDNAVVNHVRLNAEGRETLALSTLAARLGAHVSFNTTNVVAGSAFARHQVFLRFDGDHSKAQINGATMINGREHADTTLVVEHAAPHCESRELFKTVIDGEATGVFQGKIIVQPHAQKTDGRMMSAALLLAEGGAMNNKPELEIFADDVQCGHGATCGALDEDLLFYLMARGLPKPEAESLLVQAFLGEAIETVEHESVREALIGIVEKWLRARS